MRTICEVHGRKIIKLTETKYADGNKAVFAAWDDGDLSKVSVNLPEQASQLQEGEFFLKDYTECEEQAKALLASGVIIKTGFTVQAGYTQVPIVKIV